MHPSLGSHIQMASGLRVRMYPMTAPWTLGPERDRFWGVLGLCCLKLWCLEVLMFDVSVVSGMLKQHEALGTHGLSRIWEFRSACPFRFAAPSLYQNKQMPNFAHNRPEESHGGGLWGAGIWFLVVSCLWDRT